MIIKNPVLEPSLVLVERQIPVFGLFLRQRIAGLGIIGIDQFVRGERSAAFLALVAVRAQRMAARTFAADITIGKEMSGLGVVELLGSLFHKLACVIHRAEIVCRKLMMDRRGGTRVDIIADTELLERRLDEFVITVYHLLRGDAFFSCADSHRHAVLVATADEEDLLAFEAQITGVDIRRNIDACQVPDMNRTIGIRQCSCD